MWSVTYKTLKISGHARWIIFWGRVGLYDYFFMSFLLVLTVWSYHLKYCLHTVKDFLEFLDHIFQSLSEVSPPSNCLILLKTGGHQKIIDPYRCTKLQVSSSMIDIWCLWNNAVVHGLLSTPLMSWLVRHNICDIYGRHLMFGVKWSWCQGLSTHQFSWFYWEK